MDIITRIVQRLKATAITSPLKVKPSDIWFWEDDLKPSKFKPLGVPGYFYQEMDTSDSDRILVHDEQPVGQMFVTEDFGSDRIVTPHSKLLPEHTGNGLMPRMYQKVLDQGYCFVTGTGHTAAANKLWQSLAKHNPWFMVKELPGHKFEYIGQDVPEKLAKSTKTRIVILGKGWTVEKLMREI